MPKSIKRRQKLRIEPTIPTRRKLVFLLQLWNAQFGDESSTLLDDFELLQEYYEQQHLARRRTQVACLLLWDRIKELRAAEWGPFAKKP